MHSMKNRLKSEHEEYKNTNTYTNKYKERFTILS